MKSESAAILTSRENRIEDFEIILEVLSGNREAYAEIVRRYEARVRGYCLTMLSDPTAAEDAAQEIFIKAYQALAGFRGNASFSTWLYRIAANHCTDALRKKARRKTESWEALLEKDGERIEALFSVFSDVESSERAELVAKLLSHLTEKSKAILTLREIHGLSYQELAETLECSLDAVKARLKRARQEAEIKWRHLFKVRDV